jgi:hypothetical protein
MCELLMIDFTNSSVSGTRAHPAYDNLRQHAWLTCEDKSYAENLTHILTAYGAKAVVRNNQVILEFCSQEDLTQFVLTWS